MCLRFFFLLNSLWLDKKLELLSHAACWNFLSKELNRKLGYATILSLGWFCWKHQTQKNLKTSEVILKNLYLNLPLKAPEPELLHEKSLMETEFPRPHGEFSSKWPSISGSPSSQPITKSLILSGVFKGRASFFQPKQMEKNKRKTPFGWDNFHRSHFSLQRGVEEDGC